MESVHNIENESKNNNYCSVKNKQCATCVFTVIGRECEHGDGVNGNFNCDNYNPYQHRNVEHPTSNLETTVHLLKCFIGTGILAMPQAFKNAGLIVGVIGLILIGIICVYSMHTLLWCTHILCKRYRRPSLKFSEVFQLSLQEGPQFLRPLAPHSIGLIDGFICITEIGICCLYLVFVATNLRMIMNDLFDHDLSVKTYLAILLAPMILLNWIRNLKFLAPVMTIATILMSIGLGTILYHIFKDLNFQEALSPDRKDFHFVFSGLDDVPLFFGTALYAFGAIEIVLPLENKMRTPQQLGGTFGVLNVSMFIIGLCFLTVGFFGYLKYGQEALGSVTLNLPEGEIFAICVRIVLTCSIFLSYALKMYISVSIAWPSLETAIPKWVPRVPAEIAFRTILVVITYALSVVIPNLALVISLLGAFCTAVLALILPPILSMCTNWKTGYGLIRWRLIRDSLLLIFGCFGCFVGTYVSVSDIITYDES